MSSLSEGIYEDGLNAGYEKGRENGYQRGVDEAERREAIRTAEVLIETAPEWSDAKIAKISRGVSAQEVGEIRKGIKLK